MIYWLLTECVWMGHHCPWESWKLCWKHSTKLGTVSGIIKQKSETRLDNLLRGCENDIFIPKRVKAKQRWRFIFSARAGMFMQDDKIYESAFRWKWRRGIFVGKEISFHVFRRKCLISVHSSKPWQAWKGAKENERKMNKKVAEKREKSIPRQIITFNVW